MTPSSFSPRIAELKTQHDAAQTEKERAAIESHVLTELRRIATAPLTRAPRLLIAEALGLSNYAVEHRRTLLLSGDLAEPLWDLVDYSDLTLASAVDLLRRAKQIRIQPETTAHALRRAIAQYYALPVQRHIGNGKVTRHNTPEPRIGRPPGRTTQNQHEPREPAVSPKSGSPKPPVAGDFWGRLRGMCLEHAKGRLPEHNDEQIEPDVRLLETDLKIAFEQFSDRIRNRLRDTPLTVVIARRQVTEACRALMLDPPRDLLKVPPAFFDKAKRQFKALAREYHPDTSSGGEATRSQFESVMQAWNVLQLLQQQAQRTTSA